MPNPRLASRYAKALLDLAVERGQLEAVYADMQWLRAATKGSHDFLNLLRSPIIKAELKTKAVNAVTEGKISELTRQFNTLLIRKNRESVLPEITTAFEEQYLEHKGIHVAELTTAVPVSEQTRNNIIQKAKQASGFQNILLEEKVDPSLIGGFVLQMGDQMVDASVSSDLREITKQFKNNDFIYRVR